VAARRRQGQPLFGVSFSFQEMPPPALAVGPPVQPVELPVDPMFPLVIAAAPAEDAIVVWAACQFPRAERDTAEL
jgi:hypothetical protein